MFLFVKAFKFSFRAQGLPESIYMNAAQYNAPPTYPTTQICQGINGTSNATDILDRVFAGIVALLPGRTCYIHDVIGIRSKFHRVAMASKYILFENMRIEHTHNN